MVKSFFYRHFGFGKISESFMSQLQSEGILLLDEGVKGSVTYINFHRPGKSSGWERRGMIASIAVTKTRFLALNSSIPVINVTLTDKRLSLMRFLQEDAETLYVAFDANLFQSDWSGKVEYRFRTTEASHFLELLPKAPH